MKAEAITDVDRARGSGLLVSPRSQLAAEDRARVDVCGADMRLTVRFDEVVDLNVNVIAIAAERGVYGLESAGEASVAIANGSPFPVRCSDSAEASGRQGGGGAIEVLAIDSGNLSGSPKA